MEISIDNRQRRLRVIRAELQIMTARLSEAVCDNLLTNPTGEYPRRKLERLRRLATVNLVLVSNSAIAKLNKLWRGKNVETDVLSFTLNSSEPPAGIPWELGEIFISAEKAFEQAETLNHSLDRELAFLFVHGMLHILGFDHENTYDEKIMRQRQRAILKAGGYPRL